MPTTREVKRLVRGADMVEIDNYRYSVEAYNFNVKSGVMVWMNGSKLGRFGLSWEELLKAETVDAVTLRVGSHHVVFVRFERLKIHGQKNCRR